MFYRSIVGTSLTREALILADNWEVGLQVWYSSDISESYPYVFYAILSFKVSELTHVIIWLRLRRDENNTDELWTC